MKIFSAKIPKEKKKMGKMKRKNMKLTQKAARMNQRNWRVYLLKNTHNNYTYLGVTNNDKRIRRHNGELSGGARYTRAKKGDGKWIYHCTIENLTKREALSIERTAKNFRKKAIGDSPLKKRTYALQLAIKDRDYKYTISYFHNVI